MKKTEAKQISERALRAKAQEMAENVGPQRFDQTNVILWGLKDEHQKLGYTIV